MSEVLWLNKETLEERWLHPYFCFINPSLWVEVPEGATFATGGRDNFVFRKDGWYYEDGEWVETEVTFDKVGNYKQLKLFWAKGVVKGGSLSNNFKVAWEQVFGENFVDSVIKAVKQNKEDVVKNDTFKLERLLGCEVEFSDPFGITVNGYISKVRNSGLVHVTCGSFYGVEGAKNLTFFTEDGDELTFDEYVQLYYPEG